METLAILAVVGLVLYLHEQRATTASPISPSAVPTTTAAQSGMMFAGIPVRAPFQPPGKGPLVSAGYQILPPFTPLGAAFLGPASGTPLASTPSYPLPPAPPIPFAGGLSGPGTGGNPLTGPRRGLTAGTGTTVVQASGLALAPRTGILL